MVLFVASVLTFHVESSDTIYKSQSIIGVEINTIVLDPCLPVRRPYPFRSNRHIHIKQ